MVIKSNTVSFCIPILAKDFKEARREIVSALQCNPDFIEFRRDFFRETQLEREVLNLLKSVRDDYDVGVIYTFRSKEEGGKQKVTDRALMGSLRGAIKAHACDYVDYGKFSDSEMTEDLANFANQHKVKVISSTHNFQETPSAEEIGEILEENAARGDVVKAAFTTESNQDLVALIEAGNDFREKHPRKPLILIGMGSKGVISRVMPELFASNLSFVTDNRQGKASAPGQLSFEDTAQARELILDKE